MNNKKRIFLINTFHVIVYVIMVLSIFYIAYAAIAKDFGILLLLTLELLTAEVVVFIGSGMRCPITDLSKKYGTKNGYAFESFLSKKLADRIFNFFRALLIFAIIFLITRYFGWL